MVDKLSKFYVETITVTTVQSRISTKSKRKTLVILILPLFKICHFVHHGFFALFLLNTALKYYLD